MRLQLVTPPAEEPVTLAEAKKHLRLEIDDDDDLVTGLIAAARRVCETRTKRVFITQTWDYYEDNFPFGGGYYNRHIRQLGPSPLWLPTNTGIFEIPKAPILSVVSVTYTDFSGNAQVIPENLYTFTAGFPSRVQPVYGQVWPLAQPRIDSVSIRFTAGYGAATDVPANVKAAMKLLIGNWYENRESVVIGTIVSTLPDAVDSLLAPEDWGFYT